MGRGMWPDDTGGPKKEDHPEPIREQDALEELDKEKKTDEQRKKVETQRRLDEGTTTLTDHFPIMWWGLYTKSMEAGFKEEQAMSLVKCYILKDGIYGIHIHKD